MQDPEDPQDEHTDESDDEDSDLDLVVKRVKALQSTKSLRSLRSITSHFQNVNVKEIIENDLLGTKLEADRMVDATKANIAHMVRFCSRDEAETPPPIFDRDAPVHASATKIIKQGIDEAKLDLQVIQLYDQYLNYDIQEYINKSIIEKNIHAIKEKTRTDFQSTQENTDSSVSGTKTVVENFIQAVGDKVAQEEESDNAPLNELWRKLKNKAQNDFNETNEMAQELTNIAMEELEDNFNVFLINPAGSKSREEIQSEKFIERKVVHAGKQIKRDLKKEKVNFQNVVDNTVVGLNVLFESNAIKDTVGTNPAIIRFCDKRRNEFKQVNEKLQEGVAILKDQIELPDIPEEPMIATEDIPDALSIFTETAQADFKDTNDKIQDDVKELKEKITQAITSMEDPENMERQKEVSKAIENSLNVFQDMAKNDFQETNEKVLDNVSVAKSKIDKSLKKIKDNLFFTGFYK